MCGEENKRLHKFILINFFFAVALLDQQCANRVATGAAVGGALGASIGKASYIIIRGHTRPVFSVCVVSFTTCLLFFLPS